MVHKFNSARTDFILSDIMPEDNPSFSRKGGCFVSICRGISIAVLILTFVFFLSFTIFFATKYAYEPRPNITLESYLNRQAYLIDKHIRIPKHVIPKHYRILLHPFFNETDNPFSFIGTVWITIVSKKHNNKRIELNVKNLNIKLDDVSVHKSMRLTNLDFDDDSDWDSSEVKYPIQKKRIKRDNVGGVVNTLADEADEGGEELDTTTKGAAVEVISSSEQSTVVPEHTDSGLTTETNEDLITVDDSLNSTNPINPLTNATPVVQANSDNSTKYSSRATLSEDDFVTIKVTDLEYDEPNDKLLIYLGTEMKKDIYYIVKVTFAGNMTLDKGLYYTQYENEDNSTSYFAATILEPNKARMLFPCMEDYNYLTPFDLNIVRRTDQNITTLSTSSLNDTEIMDEPGKLIIDDYNTTSSIRASEIGFVVTDIIPKEFVVNENLTFTFYVRGIHTNELNFTVSVIPTLLEIYEKFMGMAFPYQRVKYISIPNSAVNFREIKDGMILSSENHILFDKNYNASMKNYIDQEIAYEIALLWIHNFIDYRNKEQLWIHESIPLYMQIIALNHMESHVGQSSHLLIEDRLRAMREEINFKTTSLTNFNYNWDDIEYHMFIKQKGLSMIRMLRQVLGENVLHAAIGHYFEKRKNRERANFYDYLHQSLMNSTELTNVTSNLRIVDFISSWASYERYPIVQMQQIENSSNILLQQVPNKFEEESCTYLKIPISYTNSATLDFEDKIAVWVQHDGNNQTLLENAVDHTNQSAWVIFNPEGIGYYRLNYDEANWKRLTQLLHNDPSVLPYVTRSVLVDDALNLARFGLLNYSTAFNLVAYLKNEETSFHPWKAALENLKFVYKMLEDQSNFYVIEEFLKTIITPEYARQIQINVNGGATDQKEQQRISVLMLEWGCLLGFPECINQMKAAFQGLVDSDGNLQPSQKSQKEIYLMVCNSLRYGGSHEFNIILSTVYTTTDIVYQRTLLRSLGCTKELSLLAKFLRLLTKPVFFKLYDDILVSISENPVAVKVALDYFSKHWIYIKHFLNLKQISIVFRAISNENEFNLFRQIFATFPETFTLKDKDLLRATRNTILKKLEWKDKIAPKITYENTIDNE